MRDVRICAHYRIGIDEIVTRVRDMLAMGIDIGGSGIKAAIIDTESGELISERIRVRTPTQIDAARLVEIVVNLLSDLEWSAGPVGIGFPGVIHRQVVHTAINLDPGLVGLDLPQQLKAVVDGPVRVINDADAAGFAEMRLGAGQPYCESGTVLLLTVGTGIGTVLFSDGVLVPNLELGHVEYRGGDAELYVSERVRKQAGLSWKQWGKRFNGYLQHLEFLVQPDFIILGGGGVKKADKVSGLIQINAPWGFARFGNRAGIIGAAVAAAEGSGKRG
jgi:polyphosphate glucokinase